MAREAGFGVMLSFLYGQRHGEIAAAGACARGAREHRLVEVDLGQFGGSALTDAAIAVPKDRGQIGSEEPIPVTYVPARNLVFLSYAVAWAEVLGAFDVFIGVNATDYSGYPDCRLAFVEAFERTANLATAAAVEGRGYFVFIRRLWR